MIPWNEDKNDTINNNNNNNERYYQNRKNCQET